MLQHRSVTIIARWIFIGVAMLIVQVLLGGITRLTGSGLSITEWKPLMGTLPPLNNAEWDKAFSQYQQIAQFKYINQHFNLSNFKFIFFWEWFHRLWARLIGLVFLFPFLYFLYNKYFKQWMVSPLIILFILGGLQGALGWIMVKSGLNDTDVYVNHIRLAIHFMAAMVLICYALIFGLKLTVKPQQFVYNPTLFTSAVILVALICIQLIYGAFMAGLKAAVAAPTWPLINGDIIPSMKSPFFTSIFHDKLTIHFIHRTLAYSIGVYIFIWWIKAYKEKSSNLFNIAKHLLLVMVGFQIVLGIATVLSSQTITAGVFGTFEWLAQLHQLAGMLLLLCAVTVAYLTKKRSV